MWKRRKSAILSTAYLAPIEYYVHLICANPIFLEKKENYVNQSYRNRCIIISPNGLQTLNIPIIKTSDKCLIKDTKISTQSNWQHIHWHTLISAYRSSPFFQYYEDDFRIFYTKKQVYLYDFNEKLRELMCKLLNIHPKITYTKKYIKDKDIEPNQLDLRDKIHPKKKPTIKIFKPYYQRFEYKFGFQTNLSIIDLLFNMGKKATELLEQLRATNED